jgi:hypothetical protein
VISLARLPSLVTLYRFTTTIETFLEISYINYTRNRDIESSKTICAHEQILRRIGVYSYIISKVKDKPYENLLGERNISCIYH